MSYSPIPPIYIDGAKTAAAISSNRKNNVDFERILAAQMAMPDLSSLFGEQGNIAEDSTSDSGQTSFLSGLTLQMEMSIWSKLIGKTITGKKSSDGLTITGTAESLSIINDKVMFNVAEFYVYPESITSVK